MQWTKAELEQLEFDNIEREKQRLKKLGLQVERNMTDFEPLHTIEDPPSTFRAQDERHRAQYHDTLFVIGRLQNFQKRIAILKEERIVLQDQRSLYGPVLEYQHFEMLRSDDKLKDLEIDLDRAGSYQQVIRDMRLQWELGKNVLATAERDYRDSQIVCAGLADDVLEARDLATFLHEETNTMLRTKHLLDSKTESLESRMSIKKVTTQPHSTHPISTLALPPHSLSLLLPSMHNTKTNKTNNTKTNNTPVDTLTHPIKTPPTQSYQFTLEHAPVGNSCGSSEQVHDCI